MSQKNIRESIASFVKSNTVHIGKMAPTTLAIALACVALLPFIKTASPELAMGIAIVSGAGTEFLKNLGKDMIAKWGKKKDEEVLKELEAQIFKLWNLPGEKGIAIRLELSEFLQRNGILQMALDEASQETREDMVQSFISLAKQFEEFKWVLDEIKELLVTIQKRQVEQLATQREQLDLQREQLAKTNLLIKIQHERKRKSIPPESNKKTKDLEPADTPCPYKGLTTFQSHDSEYFFGREKLTSELLTRLAAPSFLGVVGPSGSGKSSLVRAGLIPALWNDEIPGSADWKILIMRPGSNPLEELAVRIALQSGISAASLLTDLQQNSNSLRLALKQFLLGLDEKSKFVLVVDQFEEIFAQCENETEREQFISALATAAQVDSSRVIIILTLRADFYGRCATYPMLARLLSENHVLVGSMESEELTQAMVLPAEQAGLELEPGLVEMILHETEGEAGALPMISHVLLETWNQRQGNCLKVEAYRSSGGVHRAIASTAENLYNSCTTSEQELLRQIFLRLTQLNDTSSEDEYHDTRRRVPSRNLIPMDHDSSQVENLLNKLTDARLIVKSMGRNSEPEVEVAHEAVIRHWDRLRIWLTENRETLKLIRSVSDAAREWEMQGRDENLLLHRGGRLDDSLKLGNQFTAQEQSYLDACENIRKQETARSQRLRQRIISGLAVGLLAVAVIAAYASMQWQRAEQKSKEALARQLAAQSQISKLDMGHSAILSGLLAVEAGERLSGFESDQALRRYLDVSALPDFTLYHDDTLYSPVFSVTYRPDGKYIASSGNDNTIRIWDALTGKPVVLIRDQYGADGIHQIAYSPDGRYIVANGSAFKVHVWEALTGREITHVDYQMYVSSVAFSPDGKYVVSASHDKTIRVWEALTGREITRMQHEQGVSAVAFSPDGKYVVSGGYDKVAHVWDAFTGADVAQVNHQDFVTTVAYSSDGKYVTSGSWDGTIQIWEPLTGQVIYTLLHDGAISEVAFSPDGRLLISGSSDNTARVWNVASGQEVVRFKHQKPVRTVIFSPDGKYAATGSYDETARVWDIRTGRELARMSHSNAVFTIAFSPDGKQVASGSVDRTVHAWQAMTGRSAITFSQGASIQSSALSKDGRYVATGGTDKAAHVWEITSGREIAVIPSQDTVRCIQFTPDGRYIVIGDVVGNLQVWDMTTQKKIHEMKQDDFIWAIDISPDGKYAVSSSSAIFSISGNARVWEISNAREISHLTLEGRVFSSVFSPDGRYVLSGSDSMSLRVILWDASTGSIIKTMAQVTGGQSVAFSPDGKYIASNMAVWEIATGQEIASISNKNNSPVNKVVFSPDGKYVVTSSGNGTLYVFETLTGREQHHINYEVVGDVPFAFSPDGRYIISGSGDGGVFVWELATGLEVTAVYHEGAVTSVAFTPDNRYILSGSEDGTASLWYLNIEDLIQETCRRLPRNFSMDEWQKYLGDEPYRATCSNLPPETEQSP